ncbi:MAG TPA: methyltransferase domain-containing protein [Vicinamibacterales bacterium]|nr:methyltransferase domain-containing protein [Vicinamibacterales bacterium]
MKLFAVALVALATASGTVQTQTTPSAQQKPVRPPDVIWLPTEDPVVTAMLKLAEVTKDDVVYDLGCGDGRIVIAAAKQFGARGVGIDIDPERIKEANAAAVRAGVADRVKFVVGDLFDPAVRISDASVVALYLLPSLNARLRPRLQAELKPGTRVVSNAFSMGDAWPPEKTEQVGDSVIYRWVIGKAHSRFQPIQ